MYLEYWRLKERPFENTPDRRFLYPSRNHREALQRLLYAIAGEKGCALLTGEYGCGKTVLVRTIAKQLDPKSTEIALINYPFFDRHGFLQDVLRQFGVKQQGESRADLFRALSAYLLELAEAGKKCLLVIDEAQIIDDAEVFEELRLILNLTLDDRFLITVILVGQPELREKILGFPQLDQRIAVKCHLHHFDEIDSGRYVRHRLKVAGAAQEIFTEEALYLVHKISNGIPRRINNVSDLCLLEGAARQAERIDGDVLKLIV